MPGALLAAVGLAWLAFISPGGGFLTDVLGPCLITGVGVGLVLAPVAAAATTGVASREAGMASGLFNSSRQLGGCVGLAALATIAALRTGPATDPASLSYGYARAWPSPPASSYSRQSWRSGCCPDAGPPCLTRGPPPPQRTDWKERHHENDDPQSTCSSPRCSSAPTAMSEPPNGR